MPSRAATSTTPETGSQPLVEHVVAVAAFPIGLAAALAMAIWMMNNGWSASEASGPPTFVAGVVILVLERVFPRHDSWLRSHGDVWVDIAWTVTISMTAALMGSVIAVAAVAIATSLGPSLSLDIWPTAWPWLAQLPLALVIAELPKYWHHRLQHETDLLWRFHATHHSAPRLYFLNAARFHPIDTAIDAFVGGLPLVVLGCPPEVFGLFVVLSGVHGLFQHANLQIRIGPLNYIFSMAELHRWHHSKQLEEANHNYGQNVIVWDLVFGTFFWPRDREPPEDIGIPGLPAFPMTWWQQLASPFRWRRIKEESRALASAAAATSS